MQAVKAAHASGEDLGSIMRILLERLGESQGWTLGFVYVTDPLAGELSEIAAILQETTGVQSWVGTIGVGIVAMTGEGDNPGAPEDQSPEDFLATLQKSAPAISDEAAEYHDQPAISVLMMKIPEKDICLFEAEGCDVDRTLHQHGLWLRSRYPGFGIVHGDPRNPAVLEAIDDLGRESGSFLVGGLSAAPGLVEIESSDNGEDEDDSDSSPGDDRDSSFASPFASGQPGGSGRKVAPVDPDQVVGHVTANSISGVLFAGALETVTGLSQGCMPIGPVREITDASRNVISSLNNQSALGAFLEDVGPEIAADLQQVAGRIYAALPVEGASEADYLVRNLLAIDPGEGWIAIAEEVSEGDRIMFCVRDQESAAADMWKMLKDVKKRAGRKPRAGLYYSCIARGPGLFPPPSSELAMIRAVLGDFPLAGFFGNGEISHSRVYGYTGILTLFL